MIEALKKHKLKIIFSVIAVIALVIAFISGGSIENPEKKNDDSSSVSAIKSESVTNISSTEPFTKISQTEADSVLLTTESGTVTSTSQQVSSAPAVTESFETTAKQQYATQKSTQRVESHTTENDKNQTNTVPKNKPKPVEPQEQTTSDNKLYCTFSISCASVLDNMDKLENGKEDLIPPDGWILKPIKVGFNEGESVFDVLQRVCKENKIHMEFSWTPIYNSAYIEGIGNLYEFDCGSNSGWMLSVNGWFADYGSSSYVLQNNDVVKWQYSCDLGYDIGGGYNEQGE